MRARTITAIVVLGAAVIAAGASANFKSVNDPRGDTKCSHRPCSDSAKRNADIVRATAGEERGHLKHTIRVAGNAPQGGALRINIDSDPGCEWKIGIPHRGEFISSIVPCSGEPNAPTRCCAEVHRNDGTPSSPYSVHNVVITFKKKKIGSPRSYGWRAQTEVGFHTFRHGFASMLIERGTSILQVSRLLGHHSAAFTLRVYGHVLADDQAAPLDPTAELAGVEEPGILAEPVEELAGVEVIEA